ncbi:DUF5391 family protein [Rummeliibacillus pycnus]|uniref:DUF5391 family protein n=1 Tax=Rummeliibacillus pycnus TaxID=101070 RepID=UPI003D2DFF3C
MTNKKSITVTTILSALLFCALIVASSLSPISEYGKNTNQFNSLGMWSSIGMILLFYAIPLFMYLTGLTWMKYIMTFLCAFGIFIFVSALFAFIVFGIFTKTTPSLMNVFIVCVLAIITNIIWFFIAFHSKGSKTPVIVQR